MKYFPSRVMLVEKLSRKTEDSILVQRVMADLDFLMVEDKIIENRVHGYLSQGKTSRYIRTKLFQKKFDPELINLALLAEEDVVKNPETYRTQIKKYIQKGIQKCSSKKILHYELQMTYPDARELAEELLEEYSDIEMIQKKAPELLKKYTQEQVVSKLCQKGFRLSDIYTILRRR